MIYDKSKNAMSSMNYMLEKHSRERLHGLSLKTCARKASVTSKDMYLNFCDEFGHIMDIHHVGRRKLSGTGGTLRALAETKDTN